MELIKANKRLFDAIVALHPELCMGVKEEEELYLAMHLAKEATNNHKEQVNVTLGSVSKEELEEQKKIAYFAGMEDAAQQMM